MSSPIYSFIIPVYNEAANISEVYHRLQSITKKLDAEFELILIDDGSRDHSLSIIRELHEQNPHVRYLSFARNFGHQVAVTAGLNFAQGQVVIVMDSDLQDPPELIPDLIEKWRQGYHVVYAQRLSRKQEKRAKRLMAYVFYRTLQRLSNVEIPADTGDFCLMDRQVVDLLNAMPERNRYIRGLRAWVGFKQTAVPFKRDPRFAGEVKYTFRKSLGLAIDGIVAFSRVPLRLATYLGLFSAGLALLMAFLVLYWRFFEPEPRLLGFTAIAVAIFFLGAVQLVCIGILGEYIGRIYEEVKGRPLYTLRELGGFTKPANYS